jgi:nucleoside-diphosphate-sugar epimerase
MSARSILVTGATGLIGGDVLERVLRADPATRAHVVVRSERSRAVLVRRLGALMPRVSVHSGDVALPELGLRRASRRAIAAEVDLVVHCAADTSFSQTLARARRQNRDGTRHVLEVAGDCRRLRHLVHVSTAFVAGRMTGSIAAEMHDGAAGFINAYEQSKHEAERHVRKSDLPWTIVRPSTVVCDGIDGVVRQVNAVHRALLLCRAGLASLVPGEEDTLVDLVTTDYVAGGIATLALRHEASQQAWHLCAGAGAMPLGELLDRSWTHWRRDGRWERRGVARPALTRLPTYRLFEAAVEETGDARLRAITRSLTHFVPQLALPKLFETAATDSALGFAAPPVRSYWTAMLDGLMRSRRPEAA